MAYKTNYFVLKLIFRVIFIFAGCYTIYGHLHYKNIAENTTPIQYTYKMKFEHNGGRGNFYDMKILYNNQKYKLPITRSIFNEIDKGNLPPLYYSAEKDTVFSMWTITLFLRLTILPFLFFLITFIPYKKKLSNIQFLK